MNTETRKACQKANHICDKVQYKEVSFLERIKLLLHLIFCSVCRKYTKKNVKLTKSIKKSRVACMHKNEKEALKESLRQAIQEQQKQP